MSVEKKQFKIPDGNGGVKVCQFATSADMVEGLDEIDSFQTKYNTLSEKIDEMKTAMLDSISEVEHNSQARYQTVLQQIESAESGISETAQSRYAALAARVSELEDKIDEAGIIVAQTRYTVPTIADVFTYNGQVQTPVLQNFRENIMTIMTDSSVTSATNAGDYAITVRLADGKMWEGDTTEDKIIGWAIKKSVATVPTIEENNFTYDGNAKTPTIKNFRENIMTIVTDSSVTSATNAGDYSIEIQLDDPANYTWTDGTTENKTLAWQVAKAASVLSLSANSGSVNYSGTSTFRVASQTGDGALSVASANESYVTATISDATITLSGVQANSDATVITVTKAETQNYTGATATYNCVVNKIAGSIKIVPTPKTSYAFQGTTPATYDPDTNTMTLNDEVCSLTITLEREGDGEIEGWEYYTDVRFVGQPSTPNGNRVDFKIVGVDTGQWGGRSLTQAQETRRIVCKEGTNHKAAYVEINLVSTARRRVAANNFHCMKNPAYITDPNLALVYNGNEQSVSNLNDETYWKYEMPESNYKNRTFDNVHDILLPLDEVWNAAVFEFTSGSSATNAGTHQAWLHLKDTTRYRWSTSTDPETRDYVSSWQWAINRFELTADSGDYDQVLGGYSGAPNQQPAYSIVNDTSAGEYFYVTVYGALDHFSPDDLTTECTGSARGAYVELAETGRNLAAARQFITYRYYPRFSKTGQQGSVTIKLSTAGKTNYQISGSTSANFKFLWQAGTISG